MSDLLSIGRDIAPEKKPIRFESNHTGYLSKAWYKIGGELYLVKGNSIKDDAIAYEPYSEVLASCVAESLGLPHVEYSITEASRFPGIRVNGVKHVSLCKKIELNQTGQLLSFNTLLNPIGYENFEELLTLYRKLRLPDEDLFRMLLFDALIGNTDRHINNWEYIVSKSSIQAAPLYDNGASLRAMVPDSDLSHIGDLYPDEAKSFGFTHKEIVQEISDRCNKRLFNVKYEELHCAFISCLTSMSKHLSEERIKSISDYFECRFDEYLSHFI